MAQTTDVDRLAREAASLLRRAILQRLGLASPLLLATIGCSGAPPSGEEGGVTTDPSSGSTVDPESGEASSASSMGETGMGETGMMDSSESGEIRLDVMPIVDIPPPPQCNLSWMTESEVVEQYPDCSFGPLDPNLGGEFFKVCVDLPPSGDCAEICPPDELCEGSWACYWGEQVFETCGPFQEPEGCCVVFFGEQPPPIGRPFVIAAQTRLAQAPALPHDRVAAHWLAVAQGEHASIAAFARFIAVLQRHGAPARLLGEAIAAAGDEAHHTQLSLALAERFAGRSLALGGLAIDRALLELDDLDAAVCAAVREGCIGETLAAHEAACLAAAADDPEVVAALEQIAADEARHAGLAWSFVAWALARHPHLRPSIAACFADANADAGEPESTESDARALALGCPPPRLRARWRHTARRELVGPCARSLLATDAEPRVIA